ncbi:hypothetical protein AALO_G00214190 [Alosa alosa]|uniref:Uncharacterized protein n=1 Tax=Alosa alosa TaxID=278164 RepID=A0AAV6G7H1_9TELE|nr:uncharacterized protein si:ch211-161h7.5 [Alosa alosa]KAG5268586.1 hypothetical protein AALO_G00214190 [Alosa alosa]
MLRHFPSNTSSSRRIIDSQSYTKTKPTFLLLPRNRMGDHNVGRLSAIVVSFCLFIIMLIFNTLAGPGLPPFLNGTGDISDKYDTQITPSGWTFSIWGVIYVWLTLMHGYILSTVCRRNAYGYMYCSPPILPYGFFISWILNMILNIAWLLLWDREEMIGGLVVLASVAFTNYAMIFFSCHGLKSYGAWLNKYHKVDLWLMRVLVQNAIGVYTTWTTIATLINLTIVMDYNGQVSTLDAGTVSLSILLVEVLVWFVVENFVLDKHVRYILTIYPVIIVALTGNMTKNFNAAAPSRNGIFIAVLLALACALFAIRIILVVWRHIKKPFYMEMDAENVKSPMEIAEKQKKIFA